MKKIFTVVLALVSTISMFAAINSQLTIYLDTDSKEVEARVACGDNYSPFNAGICAAYFASLSNASNIGLYIAYEGGNYMELYTPQLVNVPVVVVTSREAASQQNYTFYAELGLAANNNEAVYMTDLRPDGGGAPVTFQLNDATDYSFSLSSEAAYVEGTNSVIADRFVINYHAADYTVTTNAYGWSTFAVAADVEWLASESPELKAYSGLVSADASALDLYEIAVADAVPAGEGVIFHGAANTTYNLYNAASATPIASNDLIGCTADKDVTAESNVFVLSGNAFQEYTGTYIPAGKAYIHVNTGSAAPAQRMAIRIHPVATGVEAVAAEAKAEKLVRDGQLLILRDGKTYNVQGQLVK